MRILVAGWHGQVAMALTEAAARRSDVEAYAVGRPALDLTDRPAIGRTLFGIAPDVIINTAAYTDVEGAELEPVVAFNRNTLGAAALASQAARIGIPIIHLSTVYVFDGKQSGALTETDPVNPINAYGRSKRAGEAAVARANPKHIILRTGWIYSPFGNNFITNILTRSRSETNLTVDSSQTGSPTYAPHAANAILDVASQITTHAADSAWGVYHIADNGTTSWCELACATFARSEKLGRTCPKITATDAITDTEPSLRAARPRNAALDCSKLNKAFGIEMPAWQDGIKDCVDRLTRDNR